VAKGGEPLFVVFLVAELNKGFGCELLNFERDVYHVAAKLVLPSSGLLRTGLKNLPCKTRVMSSIIRWRKGVSVYAEHPKPGSRIC
jgi:hypothetical protein